MRGLLRKTRDFAGLRPAPSAAVSEILRISSEPTILGIFEGWTALKLKTLAGLGFASVQRGVTHVR